MQVLKMQYGIFHHLFNCATQKLLIVLDSKNEKTLAVLRKAIPLRIDEEGVATILQAAIAIRILQDPDTAIKVAWPHGC